MSEPTRTHDATTMRFDHLGVAVADLDKTVESYQRLFGHRVLAGPFDDPLQQARVVFLGGGAGGYVVELIAPLTETSHVARIVAKGAGAYHVCYEVDDIASTISDMRAQGCMLVSGPVPAVAFQGRSIAWLYTPVKQLIELVEAAAAAPGVVPDAASAATATPATSTAHAAAAASGVASASTPATNATPASPRAAPATLNELRAEADRAIAAGETMGAHGLLARLWAADPGLATAGFIVTRFDKLKAGLQTAPCRVALLRSFTVEPLVPLLRAASAVGGIDVAAWIGEFNAYAQEVLDPASRMYAFDPTVVFVAVLARDVAPELWERFPDLSPGEADAVVERVLAGYRAWVAMIRSRSQAHVVIHNLELPDQPSAGVLDGQDTRGQAACLRRINAGLIELARSTVGVSVLDYDALIARHGRRAWHDERKWQTMRMPISAECLTDLAQEWVRYLHPITGRVAKCLVLDLDNTLWGGVVGEDGMHGIQIGLEPPGRSYREFQRAILDVTRRGIILAIVSKNNPDDAMEVLEKHEGMLLRPEHFASLRINWDDKASNLRAVAAELNIGVDALAFFDDNPAERALVRQQLPEVMVLEVPDDPALFARALRESPVFERLSVSAEDRERGVFYAQDRQRSELEQSIGSLEDFYRSLEQEAEIGSVSSATLARVAQLTQKTNQFNMTTRRYTEPEIAMLAADRHWFVDWIRVRDRFGDNGIVGVTMAHDLGAGAWEIDNFLMSCRVIGRTVETAVLATLIERVRAAGGGTLAGWFIPTKKNAPARDFYRNHGFTLAAEQDGRERWELGLVGSRVEVPPWIHCVVQTETTA